MARLRLLHVFYLAVCFASASQTPLQEVISDAIVLSSGREGAVATETHVCTDVGIDLLRLGGNAADAMVGSTLCLGVVAMYHSGIGGGGFALVRDPSGHIESIDFRETAPGAAYPSMFIDKPRARLTSGLASGVPGELRGLELIHSRYGIMNWSDVVTPAVKLARDGFEVTEDLVRFMDSAIEGQEDFFTHDPTWAVDFAPSGKKVAIGDRMTRTRYASTLEAIGRYGAAYFYSLEMAKLTEKAVQRENGIMTAEDIQSYRANILKPVTINYRGYKISSCPLPGGGPVTLSNMKVMAEYGAGVTKNLNLTTHRLNEAYRFAFGFRAELGDPAFNRTVSDLGSYLLGDVYASSVRNQISDDHVLPPEAYNPGGLGLVQTAGTTHLVTSDGTGLALSLTSTLNRYFGSHVMVPETGVILNSQMQDFSVPTKFQDRLVQRHSPNYPEPAKRPLSSSSPTIVEHQNGSLYLVLGGAGGPRIITSVSQVLLHMLDHSMGPDDALLQPRFHDSLSPNETALEWRQGAISGFNNQTAEFLRDRGHVISYTPPLRSAVHVIRRREEGFFDAAADPRHSRSSGQVL